MKPRLQAEELTGMISLLRDEFVRSENLRRCCCCPGYDVKLIRCCPQYNVKLMWRHRGNDIVSVAAICVAAICAAAQLIFLFGRTRIAV